MAHTIEGIHFETAGQFEDDLGIQSLRFDAVYQCVTGLDCVRFYYHCRYLWVR